MRMRAVMAFARVDGPSVVHLAFRVFHRSHDRYIILAYDHKLINTGSLKNQTQIYFCEISEQYSTKR